MVVLCVWPPLDSIHLLSYKLNTTRNLSVICGQITALRSGGQDYRMTRVFLSSIDRPCTGRHTSPASNDSQYDKEY